MLYLAFECDEEEGYKPEAKHKCRTNDAVKDGLRKNRQVQRL
jgi:hypothetical protein